MSETSEPVSQESKTLNFDEELAIKMAAKYNPDDEKRALEWLETLSGQKLGNNFYDAIKDGVILCLVILRLHPGSISNGTWTPKPKHYLEFKSNIKAFLNAAAAFGVESCDLFSEFDLGDMKPDRTPVLNCIFALSRTAQSKRIPDIPILGPTYYRSEEDNARIKARKEAERQQLYEVKLKIEAESQKRREELEVEIKTGSEKRKSMALSRRDSRKGIRNSMSVKERISPPRKEHENEVELKYGFDKEQRDAMKHKFEQNYADLAEAVMNWIEEITGEIVDDFQLHLKSGRTLCRLVNKIQELAGEKPLIPEKKINKMANKMKEAANLQLFIDSCEAFGIRAKDLFLPTDLYDSKDLAKVSTSLKALADKTCEEYDKKYARVPKLRYVSTKPQAISDPALDQRREQDRYKKMERIQSLLEAGLAAFKASKFSDAIKAFDELLTHEKQHAQAHFFKGKIYFQQEQFSASSRCFSSALQADPENVNAHVMYGQSLHGEELYDKAIAAFDKALGLHPEHPEAAQHRALAVKARDTKEVTIPMPNGEPSGGRSWLRAGAYFLGAAAVGAAVCYTIYRIAPEKVAQAKDNVASWWSGDNK